MKKLIFLLLIGLLLMACTKETKETIIIVEVPVEGDPDDIDGDGVKNIIEEIDGTNPQGPCSYDSNHQIFGDTTQAWRDLDCDQDGVSNGKELDQDGNGNPGPNGTNPRDFCRYNQDDQDYTMTSLAWREFDCDGDGVTNGDEVDPDGNDQNENNGTDPFDRCDLVISQQTLPPSNSWLVLDCDADCRLNYQEIEEGTDPFDGTDFLGAGNEILEIRSIDDDGSFLNVYLFDQLGTRLLGAENATGEVKADLQYDSENKLIQADITGTVPNIHISFEYQNGIISKTTRIAGGPVEIKDVQFNGNEIITLDGTEPTGLFTEKFNLDSTSEKLTLKEEYFRVTSNDYRYIHSDYIYDGTMDNLLQISTTIQGYIPSTDQYYALAEGGWSSQRFDYEDGTAVNPGYLATQNIYLNTILEPEVLAFGWLFSASEASISKRFLTGYKFGNDFFLFHAGMSILCQQDNFLPTKSYYSTLNGQLNFDFIYE